MRSLAAVASGEDPSTLPPQGGDPRMGPSDPWAPLHDLSSSGRDPSWRGRFSSAEGAARVLPRRGGGLRRGPGAACHRSVVAAAVVGLCRHVAVVAVAGLSKVWAHRR